LRTSGAKALIGTAYYGTAKAVPFVERVSSIWLLKGSAYQTILATRTIDGISKPLRSG
jgi:hypothetical protein